MHFTTSLWLASLVTFAVAAPTPAGILETNVMKRQIDSPFGSKPPPPLVKKSPIEILPNEPPVALSVMDTVLDSLPDGPLRKLVKKNPIHVLPNTPPVALVEPLSLSLGVLEPLGPDPFPPKLAKKAPIHVLPNTPPAALIKLNAPESGTGVLEPLGPDPFPPRHVRKSAANAPPLEGGPTVLMD